MRPAWIAFIAFVAILMLLVGSVPAGEELVLNTTLMDEEEEPYINYLLSYTEAWQTTPWATLISVEAHSTFFQALFNVLLQTKTRDALFPPGTPWVLIWWIFWVPIVVMVVFGVIMMFISIIQKTLGGG